MAGPILVILLFGIASNRETYAQSSSDVSTEPSLAMLSAELKAAFGPVRLHREEELEDRFTVPRLPHSDPGLLPRFFQIQRPRYDLSGDQILDNVANGIPTMYVASSADEKKIYKLYGFANPEQDFNRLVGDGRAQRILNSEEAESRGLLCGEVIYGLSSEWWIADASNAKLQAAKHYFDTNHPDAFQRSTKWWNSLKRNHVVLSISTTKMASGGFSLNLPVFWASVEIETTPQVRVYHIEVSENGTCHMDAKSTEVLK
jgi:hypothetical protein